MLDKCVTAVVELGGQVVVISVILCTKVAHNEVVHTPGHKCFVVLQQRFYLVQPAALLDWQIKWVVAIHGGHLQAYAQSLVQ